MSDLRLNLQTFDLAVSNSDLGLTTGSEATIQRVRQALQAFRGEWFLDLSTGVPYYQDILVKNPNPVVVDGVLRDAILGVPGVIELEYFDLNYDPPSRRLSLEAGVRTTEDLIDFTQILGGD